MWRVSISHSSLAKIASAVGNHVCGYSCVKYTATWLAASLDQNASAAEPPGASADRYRRLAFAEDIQGHSRRLRARLLFTGYHGADLRSGAALTRARSLGVTPPATLQLFPLWLCQQGIHLRPSVCGRGPHLLPEFLHVLVRLPYRCVVSLT